MPDVVDVLAIVFSIAMVTPVFWMIKRDDHPKSDVDGRYIGAGDGWADHCHHGADGEHGDSSGNGGDGGGHY